MADHIWDIFLISSFFLVQNKDAAGNNLKAERRHMLGNSANALCRWL